MRGKYLRRAGAFVPFPLAPFKVAPFKVLPAPSMLKCLSHTASLQVDGEKDQDMPASKRVYDPKFVSMMK